YGAEKSLAILESQAAADPSKWTVGDGVGWKVLNQTNRGYQVVEIRPDTKEAVIRPVADTGLTVDGTDRMLTDSQLVHVADLVRDNKYNKVQAKPAKQTTIEPEATIFGDKPPEKIRAAKKEKLAALPFVKEERPAPRDQKKLFEPNQQDLFKKDPLYSVQQKAVDTESKEFKDWFGKSAVVDSDGKPLVVYHGGIRRKGAEEIESFNVNRDYGDFDIGAHFGTVDAANRRISDVQSSFYENEKIPTGVPYVYEREGTRIFPVYLKIENPIRLPDDSKEAFGYGWDWRGIYRKLLAKRLVPENEKAKFNFNIARDAVEKYFKENNVDGIVYKNDYEDIGKDSYIVFEPTQ
ncbi:MAG: hypothetical protein U1C56_01280, partial [Candidatus Curtissbacteria bacterium]|nr:hypothetical protein [Candidatus Curtissbacteria bacterium]